MFLLELRWMFLNFPEQEGSFGLIYISCEVQSLDCVNQGIKLPV
jgi:hypothetical protein